MLVVSIRILRCLSEHFRGAVMTRRTVSPEQLAANGRKLIQYRATVTADLIRKAIASSREP